MIPLARDLAPHLIALGRRARRGFAALQAAHVTVWEGGKRRLRRGFLRVDRIHVRVWWIPAFVGMAVALTAHDGLTTWVGDGVEAVGFILAVWVNRPARRHAAVGRQVSFVWNDGLIVTVSGKWSIDEVERRLASADPRDAFLRRIR